MDCIQQRRRAIVQQLKNSPTEQSTSTGKSALETDRRLAVAIGDSQIRDGQTSHVLSEAPLIYCALLRSGLARAQRMKRYDAGQKRAGRKGTFAEWNRNRKKALSDVVTLMPQRQESPEASLPLPSEENKIGAFQIWIPPMVLYQSYQNTRGYTLHQRKNDSLASAGAAGVSVAYETQF